ncbi:hypothetical protein DFJ74DRAFT_674965 [Hyaloraphidium curvatum]|nr:hypothetical protein DFJ74DRAFT_674965 [Hyaloraphidium curvatum]
MLIGLAAVGMVVGSVWGPVLGWLTVTRGLPLAWNRLMRALGLAEKELEAQTSAAVRGAKHGYVDAKEHRVHEFDSNGKPSQ